MRPFLLLILLSTYLCAQDKSPSSGKEENWLQKNIEEQQKLQSNRTAEDSDKVNPFQAIAKPNEEKPKTTEPFSLIQNPESSAPKTPAKIDPLRPINTDITFKPVISGMLSDSYNRQEKEKESRTTVQQIDSVNKSTDDSNSKEEDPYEKARREKIQQNLNSKTDDKLFDNKFDLPGNLDHPNLSQDRKNPYLNQNKVQQNRDLFGNTPVNNLPTIQMIKPIETPQMIQNPALNRSVFETENSRNQNRIFNQMINTPGSNKSRVKDPNDFLNR